MPVVFTAKSHVKTEANHVTPAPAHAVCGDKTVSNKGEKENNKEKSIYKGYEIKEGIKCDLIKYEMHKSGFFQTDLMKLIQESFSYLEYPYKITKTLNKSGGYSIGIYRYKDRIVDFYLPKHTVQPAPLSMLNMLKASNWKNKPQPKSNKNTVRFHFSPAVLDAYGCTGWILKGFKAMMLAELLQCLRVCRYDVAHDVGADSKVVMLYKPYVHTITLIPKQDEKPSVYFNKGRSYRQLCYYDKVRHMLKVKFMAIPNPALTRFEHREKLVKPMVPWELENICNPFAGTRLFHVDKVIATLSQLPGLQSFALSIISSNRPERFSEYVGKSLNQYWRTKMLKALEETQVKEWHVEDFSSVWKETLNKNALVTFLAEASKQAHKKS